MKPRGLRHHGRRTVMALTLAGCGLVLAGCRDQAPAEVAGAVAVVDGQPITEAELVAFMQVRRQSPADGAQRQAALDELIDLHLLAQSARRDGLVDEQTRAQIRVQELSLLANKALARFAQNQSVTEADVAAEYERQVGLTGEAEYRIRHLLLPEQLQAIQAIERLDAGATFEQLVAATGQDTEGGDLGWVNLAQVPASFAGVLRALKPGQYSPTPIRSEYGWHVVWLDDTRAFSPPPMESVEEGIRNSLSRSRLEDHLGGLRQQADIRRLQPES